MIFRLEAVPESIVRRYFLQVPALLNLRFPGSRMLPVGSTASTYMSGSTAGLTELCIVSAAATQDPASVHMHSKYTSMYALAQAYRASIPDRATPAPPGDRERGSRAGIAPAPAPPPGLPAGHACRAESCRRS
jgi:hypothetical protein